jgi:hypothetical protein
LQEQLGFLGPFAVALPPIALVFLDVEPGGDGDGADGSGVGEADDAIGLDGEHFANAGDGSPDCGEDFGSLTEFDGDVP